MTVAESELGAERVPSSNANWTIASRLFAAVAALIFVVAGGWYAYETQHELRLIPWLAYDERVDFAYFYAGATMVAKGDGFDLYPRPGEFSYYPEDPIFEATADEYARAQLLARGNYYNPPLLAYLQAPLTRLSFQHAYWLFSILSLSAFGGYLALAWRSARGIPELPLLIMGALSFRPVHEAVIMGHTTLFFVLALTVGFLALRSGRPAITGLAFSVLALKPQWAILPALFLLARREWRALAIMAVCSALIFFSGFVLTGVESFKNYVAFLRQASKLDLLDAPHMFSWNGFLFKLHAAAASQALIYGLIGLTILPLLVVWWSRDFCLSVAATVVAMLLVSTHSVWYDWALLVIAAQFIIMRPMSPALRVEAWIVLLALFLGASQSMAALLAPDRHFIDWHRPEFYSLTLIAFGSLVWMALVTWREGLLQRPSFSLPSVRLRSAGS